MFNTQAFFSTILVVVLIGVIYGGAILATRNAWKPAVFGGAIASIVAFAILVSHVAALLMGA